MVPIVALFVAKAELYSVVLCAQDMLFTMRILDVMGLKVELPMILYISNKGAKDFVNNWSVGGSTRHVEVKQYFLQELKEASILECKQKSGSNIVSDSFTNNCAVSVFDKYAIKFVGHDEYMPSGCGNINYRNFWVKWK
eukprot:8301-Ditylum_brightwellii.AAC.1